MNAHTNSKSAIFFFFLIAIEETKFVTPFFVDYTGHSLYKTQNVMNELFELFT